MDLPLNGIRVFELGGNVAGPYATWILAAMGAEVIKVERPEGDDARGWGPPFWRGAATTFQAINRDKQSIVVDLNDEDQRGALRKRIIEEGDVVIQNMRANLVERFGLSAADLRAENPRLIYCNLRAFGREGPLKDRPGYDAMMQAFGGIMSITGEVGRPPVRAGVSVVDMGTGMWSVIGVLTALYRRKETGKGGEIDASLFETTLGWMSLRVPALQATGEIPPPQGTGARGIVPYQAYECADGRLVVAASNERLFVKFANAVGHPEWLEDERFATNAARVENRLAMTALLDPMFATRPRADWQATLDEAGVPSSPIHNLAEVLAHPQTAALGMAQPTDDEDISLLGLPISFEGERPPLRNLAPELGANSPD